MQAFLNQLKFDAHGLIPAIIQEEKSKEILMVAYMNRESLEKSLLDGYCCYWSRSRQKLWLKGESSGHKQKIKEIRLDCDGDALLFVVEQKGGACHTGHKSCFYRKWTNNEWIVDTEKIFNDKKVYNK